MAAPLVPCNPTFYMVSLTTRSSRGHHAPQRLLSPVTRRCIEAVSSHRLTTRLCWGHLYFPCGCVEPLRTPAASALIYELIISWFIAVNQSTNLSLAHVCSTHFQCFKFNVNILVASISVANGSSHGSTWIIDTFWIWYKCIGELILSSYKLTIVFVGYHVWYEWNFFWILDRSVQAANFLLGEQEFQVFGPGLWLRISTPGQAQALWK